MLGTGAVRVRRSLLLVLALALAAAGCSFGEEKKPSQPAGPTLLSVAVYGPPQLVTAFTNVAATYSSEHPNISVSIEHYPDATAAQAAVQKQIAAGTAPDLFLSPVGALPVLVEQEALEPVGDLLLERGLDFGDHYQRYSIESFSSDNHLQCMPVDSSPMVVYYNTDLVDLSNLNTDLEPEVDQESGWTFAEFEKAARIPHSSGARGVYVEPSLLQLAPFIFSGGGKLLDDEEEPTRLALGDGSTRSALQKVLPLFRDPVVNFDQREIEESSALKRFKAGELGMMLGFRSLTPDLRTATDLHFDVMPIPRVGSEATVGETSGMCLSAESQQTDQAADFLAYVIGDEAMAQLAATGYVVPSNTDIVHADAFLQPGQDPAHAGVFADQVRSIRSLPSASVWPKVLAETVPQLTQLFYDPLIQSLEERLKEIDTGSEPLFEESPPTPTS